MQAADVNGRPSTTKPRKGLLKYHGIIEIRIGVYHFYFEIKPVNYVYNYLNRFVQKVLCHKC